MEPEFSFPQNNVLAVFNAARAVPNDWPMLLF